MTITEILEKFGNQTVSEIRANMARTGTDASGRTSRELKSQATANRVIVSGLRHTPVVEAGRRAGGIPPVQRIKSWIIDKGITFEGSIDSFAWAIAKSMAKNGSKLYQRGGRSDIITPAISSARVDTLNKDIANFAFDKVLKEVTRYASS